MSRLLAPTEFIGKAGATTSAGGFLVRNWSVDSVSVSGRAHGHAEAHFVYVPQTTGYHTRARGELPPYMGNLIYHPPEIYHDDRLLAPGRFLSISIKDPADLDADGYRCPVAPLRIGSPRAHTLVKRIARLTWGKRAGEHAEELCWELLSAIQPEQKDRHRPKWIATALEMLNDLDREPITIRDLSRALSVHPKHLARAFRQFVGETPSEVSRHARLERAANLLSMSAKPLIEIALDTGFTDQSHFTNVFRRAFGMPPAKYRMLTNAKHR